MLCRVKREFRIAKSGDVYGEALAVGCERDFDEKLAGDLEREGYVEKIAAPAAVTDSHVEPPVVGQAAQPVVEPPVVEVVDAPAVEVANAAEREAPAAAPTKPKSGKK